MWGYSDAALDLPEKIKFSLMINDVCYVMSCKQILYSKSHIAIVFLICKLMSSSSEALCVGVKGFLVFNEHNLCCAAGVV